MKKFRKALYGIIFVCLVAVFLGTANFRFGKAENIKNYTTTIADESGSSFFESKYDPRSKTFITTIKNQGQLGLCWAYSILDNIEINLKKNFNYDGKYNSINLSERDFAYFVKNGKDNDTGSLTYGDGGDCSGIEYESAKLNFIYNGGGDFMQAIETAISGFGLRNQDYVENTSSVTGYCLNLPSDMDSRKDSILNVTGFRNYKTTDSDFSIENIKSAILTNGSVLASFKMDNQDRYVLDSFNTAGDGSYNFYIPSGIYTATDHLLTIVGWDDNYSRENFSTKDGHSLPTNNGAWLVKNSWGSDWGDSGFVWISYEDFGPLVNGYFSIEISELSEDQNLYQYDVGFSMMLSVSAGSMGSSITAGNIFYNKSSEQLLDGVGYYIIENSTTNSGVTTLATNQSATIKVYVSSSKMKTPIDGKEVLTINDSGSVGTCYRYVKFSDEQKVKIEKGQYFSVVVTLNSQGKTILAVEGKNNAGSYRSFNSVEGASFIKQSNFWVDSCTGRVVNGSEVIDNYKVNNVCIKAYTTTTECKHNYVTQSHVVGDCTMYGYLIKKCTLCDKVITESDNTFGPHSFGTKHIDGNCINKGYTTNYYCTICGYDASTEDETKRIYDETYGDHQFESVSITNGDCHHYSTEKQRCKLCELVRTIDREDLGYGEHNFKKSENYDSDGLYRCTIDDCTATFSKTLQNENESITFSSGFSYINFPYSDIKDIKQIVLSNDYGECIVNTTLFNDVISPDTKLTILLEKIESLGDIQFEDTNKFLSLNKFRVEIRLDNNIITTLNDFVKVVIPLQIESDKIYELYVQNEKNFIKSNSISIIDGEKIEAGVFNSGVILIGVLQKEVKCSLELKDYLIIFGTLLGVIVTGESVAICIKRKKKAE